MKPLSFFCFIISPVLLISLSCKKDPETPNSTEQITTLIYTLTPVSGGGSTVIYTSRDLDGDGSNPPVITYSGDGGDTLATGVDYVGSIELLNELTNPVTNITEEVEGVAEDHQFFYTINGLNASINYADLDDNGFPVGLLTTISTAGPGIGTIMITLIHQPQKDAPGVSHGNIQKLPLHFPK